MTWPKKVAFAVALCAALAFIGFDFARQARPNDILTGEIAAVDASASTFTVRSRPGVETQFKLHADARFTVLKDETDRRDGMFWRDGTAGDLKVGWAARVASRGQEARSIHLGPTVNKLNSYFLGSDGQPLWSPPKAEPTSSASVPQPGVEK